MGIETLNNINTVTAVVSLVAAIVSALLIAGFGPYHVSRWVRVYFWASFALSMVRRAYASQMENPRPEWWGSLLFVNLAIAAIAYAVNVSHRVATGRFDERRDYGHGRSSVLPEENDRD